MCNFLSQSLISPSLRSLKRGVHVPPKYIWRWAWQRKCVNSNPLHHQTLLRHLHNFPCTVTLTASSALCHQCGSRGELQLATCKLAHWQLASCKLQVGTLARDKLATVGSCFGNLLWTRLILLKSMMAQHLPAGSRLIYLVPWNRGLKNLQNSLA